MGAADRMDAGVVNLGPSSLPFRKVARNSCQYPTDSDSRRSDCDSIRNSSCRTARSGGVGGLKILGLVATERNSCTHGHGIAHGDVSSAKRRIDRAALSWCGLSRRCAHRRRFVSTAITVEMRRPRPDGSEAPGRVAIRYFFFGAAFFGAAFLAGAGVGQPFTSSGSASRVSM